MEPAAADPLPEDFEMRSALAVTLLLLAGAQAALHAQSADELAQKAANPIADLMSIPLQNNTDFGLGDFDRARNVLNVQPVIPLFSGKLITRTILPFVRVPDIGAESGTVASGLADVNLTAFYVPADGAFMWGFGPVIELPTGGASRGSEKWSVGPAAVALSVSGPWTLGVLANNVFSIAGEDARSDVNRGLLQYFIVRQLGDGWYVNSAPIITVNWKADTDGWIVPFGAGAGKLFFLGKLPINAQVGAYANVVKPDIGPDWQLRVQLQTLLPTPGG
jgi:hypothetical protein